MRAITAKALAALPPAPYTAATESGCPRRGQPWPEDESTLPRMRTILDKNRINLLAIAATTHLYYAGEPEEENNPQRIYQSNVVVELWAKAPELFAALGQLVDAMQSGRPAAHVVEYAERVLRDTERAVLAASEIMADEVRQ